MKLYPLFTLLVSLLLAACSTGHKNTHKNRISSLGGLIPYELEPTRLMRKIASIDHSQCPDINGKYQASFQGPDNKSVKVEYSIGHETVGSTRHYLVSSPSSGKVSRTITDGKFYPDKYERPRASYCHLGNIFTVTHDPEGEPYMSVGVMSKLPNGDLKTHNIDFTPTSEKMPVEFKEALLRLKKSY
ncbi:MAG: hypothetical protein OXB88_10975 [Bacteriovoracales bacterium]|nr:hypothetical protein [Bacteriovoracales bacterium]